jgi:hypothetical protein
MGAGLITFFISKGEQVNFLKDEQVPQAEVDEVQRLRLIMQGRPGCMALVRHGVWACPSIAIQLPMPMMQIAAT